MKVKNIFTNPLHGIKPGEVGELPKNRESRINQYVKYGMIELVEEKAKEETPAPETQPGQEEAEEPKKTRRGRKASED